MIATYFKTIYRSMLLIEVFVLGIRTLKGAMANRVKSLRTE